jgi:hypothetical protein
LGPEYPFALEQVVACATLDEAWLDFLRFC